MEGANGLRERLHTFYMRVNPENLGNVPQIVDKFLLNEKELWTQMALKYGAEAVRESAFEHERRMALAAVPPQAPPPPRTTCSVWETPSCRASR